MTLCVAVAIGAVGIRWTSYQASASLLEHLKQIERDAAVTHAPKMVNLTVGIRKALEPYALGIGYFAGFCLLGVGLGLLLGVWRVWPRPSVEALLKVHLPRSMVLTLAYQMATLWVTALLALLFLFFLADLVAF